MVNANLVQNISDCFKVLNERRRFMANLKISLSLKHKNMINSSVVLNYITNDIIFKQFLLIEINFIVSCLNTANKSDTR